MEPGDLFVQGLGALLQRPIGPPEGLKRQLVGHVGSVDLVRLTPDLGDLGFKGPQAFLLGPDLLISAAKVAGDLRG